MRNQEGRCPGLDMVFFICNTNGHMREKVDPVKSVTWKILVVGAQGGGGLPNQQSGDKCRWLTRVGT